MFEFLIGALWAIVTVLALMVKQGILYVCAYAMLGEQGALGMEEEKRNSWFVTHSQRQKKRIEDREKDRERERRMMRESVLRH